MALTHHESEHLARTPKERLYDRREDKQVKEMRGAGTSLQVLVAGVENEGRRKLHSGSRSRCRSGGSRDLTSGSCSRCTVEARGAGTSLQVLVAGVERGGREDMMTSLEVSDSEMLLVHGLDAEEELCQVVEHAAGEGVVILACKQA